MDTLMLEKQIRDWWFLSGGFYYSKLEASDFFNQTNATAIHGIQSEAVSRSHSNEQSEIFSVASLFTPLTYLTFSLGTQNEWTTEHGFGNSIPDLDLVEFLGRAVRPRQTRPPAPIRICSRPARMPVCVSQKFHSPFSLPTDGLIRKASTSFRNRLPGDPAETETQTDATNYRYNFSTGFNTSPWRWCSLNAQYQYQYSDTDYNYPIDIVTGIYRRGQRLSGIHSQSQNQNRRV